MNLTSRNPSQPKPSPVSRLQQNTYKEPQKLSQQSRKKSGGFRYTKTNFELDINAIQHVDKPQDNQDDLQNSNGFFFKNNNQIRISNNNQMPQSTVRKSPSFRVKHHLNQSNDTNRINELSDYSSDSRSNNRFNTNNQNRSNSSNPQLIQNDRRTRIAALENYIKDINDDPKQKQQNHQTNQLSTTSELKIKAYESTAYPSLLDDLEANIEEMHFYFVEFQQKSKQWMAKIEIKQKK